MFEGYTLGLIHQLVDYLLLPVIVALVVCLLLIIWELSAMLSERIYRLEKLLSKQDNSFSDYVSNKLDRLELLARSGPILGLMGTLIPLGPGLTAMSMGDLSQLSTAISVAFDTTVVGLLIGLVAYAMGKFRRRFYEQVYDLHINHQPISTDA
jgi:biopolymer transport protein ExbB/TolQ